MKSLILICYLVGWPLAGWAGRETLFQLPPHSGKPAKPAQKETEEKVSHDPFAAENAKTEAETRVSDPLQPLNRACFKFNDRLYFWVLKPVSQAYTNVAPRSVRIGVKRFIVNLRFPVRFANNTLQGKLKGAGFETTRFVVNSTLGLAGFLDPAHDELSLDLKPEDFDQTLGFFGIPPGPYLHWPFVGASSFRGTVGYAGDIVLTPWTYFESLPVNSACVLTK